MYMEFLIPLIPVVWLLLSRYWLRNTISTSEMLFGMVLIVGTASSLYYFTLYSMKVDSQLSNGQIESKEKKKTSCSHSYDCNCTSTNAASRTCSTCYKHRYDWSWRLHTTAGHVYIDRIDSRGLKTPPNWEKAYISEPVTIVKTYVNYIQAVPSFVYDNPEYRSTQQYKGFIPAYPLSIKTEYTFQHVRAYGHKVTDLDEWNNLLAESLKVLGPQKQVNVIVLIVNANKAPYMSALERRWLRGKANDVIVVIGSSRYPEIDWVAAMSWSPSKTFASGLEDAIKNVGEIKAKSIIPVIEAHITDSYEPMKMTDYKFLEDQTVISQQATWWLLGIVIFSLMFYTLLAHKYNTTAILGPISSILGKLVFVVVSGAVIGVSIHYTGLLTTILMGVAAVAAVAFYAKRLRKKKAGQDNA